MRIRNQSLLGDKRLDVPFESLLSKMSMYYCVTLRQLASSRKQEVSFGRFLRNSKITPTNLIDHYWSCKQLDFTSKHLLVIGDTSVLSYAHLADRDPLFFSGPHTEKRGFYLHPSIIMDATSGDLYGLAGLSVVKIDPDISQEAKKQSKLNARNIPFEQKERYKWYESSRHAIRNCPGARQYTLIGDRESDIYDLMAHNIDQQLDFIYRSQYNRLLDKDEDYPCLHDFIAHRPVSYTFSLDLPQTKKRSKHKAQLELRFGPLNLPLPKGNKATGMLSSVPVYVVEVKEKACSVVGQEQPIHWILLTSHAVHNNEQAMQIVEWYCWRWNIEQTFRTLKTQGLDVESSTIKKANALINQSVLALMAAVQVIQLVQAREPQSIIKIGEVFNHQEVNCLNALNQKLQGSTDKLKNPHPKEALTYASWVIARLGGWKGYCSESPPGPITICKGLSRFYNIMEGFMLTNNSS